MKHFEEVLALARSATGKEAAKRIQRLTAALESEGVRESSDQASILKTLLWRVKFGETLEGFIASAVSPDDKELATRVYRTYKDGGGR